MIDVVDDRRLRENRKKERIYEIVIDIIGREKEKKKMRYDKNEPSVNETNKREKDKNDEIDDAIVKRYCHCYPICGWILEVQY